MLSLELSVLDICPTTQTVIVDNVSFQVTESKPRAENNCVVVFGFPNEISLDELDIYLEPCRNEICSINVLRKLPSSHLVNGNRVLILENEPVVIISFASMESLTSFIEIYNNLQVPSYSHEAPPCLIFPLHELRILQTEREEIHAEAVRRLSAAIRPTRVVPATTTRSSFVQVDQPVRGSCTDGDDSSGVGGGESMRGKDLDYVGVPVKGALPLSLPTCVICMRRLRHLEQLTGASGVGEIAISRSYISRAPEMYAYRQIRQRGNMPATLTSLGDSAVCSCLVCYMYDCERSQRGSSPSFFGNANANTDTGNVNSIAVSRSIETINRGLETSTTSYSNTTTTRSSSSSNVPVIYQQYPLTSGQELSSHCQACKLTNNIWLCMQCSFAGCGRYSLKHAAMHYSETTSPVVHCGHGGVGGGDSSSSSSSSSSKPAAVLYTSRHMLSLELASGRIWDYATDNFVHVEDPPALSGQQAIWSDWEWSSSSSSSSLGGSGSQRHRKAPALLYSRHGNCPGFNWQSKDSKFLVDAHNAAAGGGGGGVGGDTTLREQPVIIGADECGSNAFSSAVTVDVNADEKSGNNDFCTGSTNLMSSKEGFSVYAKQCGAGASSGEGKGSNNRNTFLVGSLSIDANGNHAIASAATAASELLDTVTRDKLNGLIHDYERVLDQQLSDQQLYFEKLLAREMVRAMELSLTTATNATTTTTFASDKNSSGEMTLLGSQRTKPLRTFMNGSDDNTASFPSKEVEMDLLMIEEKKMRISAAEAEYSQLLDAVTITEREVLRLKKANDALIKTQKLQREKEADLLCRQEKTRRHCAEQVSELEQQVQDLTFFASAQLQVQNSPLREEISSGQMLVPHKVTMPEKSPSSFGKKYKKKN